MNGKKLDNSIGLIIFILGLLVFGGVSLEAAITVKVTGQIANSPSLIFDGKMVPDKTSWDSDTCVSWEIASVQFLFDLGAVLDIKDIVVQLDTNDGYYIDYSEDGKNFKNLLRKSSEDGDIREGMNTFSTISGTPKYIDKMDFKPVKARYIMVYADPKDGDGCYSIAEFKYITEATIKENK